jgi:hypothetical protein
MELLSASVITIFILGITSQSSKYFIGDTQDVYTIALVNGIVDDTSTVLLRSQLNVKSVILFKEIFSLKRNFLPS